KTSKLEDILRKSKSAEDFFRQGGKEASLGGFTEYLNLYLAKKGLKLSQVVANSNINKNYVYNITNGMTKNPGRDKLIALCIGAGMTFDEANRGLKIAKVGILYVKNPRDARIGIAMNNGINKVVLVNQMLEQNGLPLLDV
ncbi:MAG: hypothetical protein RR472_07455, partial [Anaerovoracaceae bacterium]